VRPKLTELEICFPALMQLLVVNPAKDDKLIQAEEAMARAGCIFANRHPRPAQTAAALYRTNAAADGHRQQ
jgi:hypothetical protein